MSHYMRNSIHSDDDDVNNINDDDVIIVLIIVLIVIIVILIILTFGGMSSSASEISITFSTVTGDRYMAKPVGYRVSTSCCKNVLP